MSPTTDQYTEEELKAALDSLLQGSKDPDHDARHVFGYKDPNHKMSMLQQITATRVLDYEKKTKDSHVPSQEELIAQADSFRRTHGPTLNLQQVIQRKSPAMALAAEFKRASPSKGDIATHLKAGEQANKYASAGADIISVLTEERWFKGSLKDMTDARIETSQYRPAILRKDFVINEYMIAEAASAGADTVLLIVAVLPQMLLERLINFSRSIGMEPLVEVHADAELDVAIQSGAKVIGINNRNLHSFQMDLNTSERVAEELSRRGLLYDHNNSDNADYTLCALSGMSNAFDVDRYRQAGIGMCLIGESLMRATDPVKAIEGLCLDPEDFQRRASSITSGGAYTAGLKIIKVCGITNAEDALVACRSGANLIGVIFAEKSPRFVSRDQAKEIVAAVRSFGERSSAYKFPEHSSTLAPLPHLVSSATVIEQATRRPLVIGVFQNHDPEHIRDIVSDCGLDLVQLHGTEGFEAANPKNCGVPAVRVVDVEIDPESGAVSGNAIEKVLNAITNDPVAVLLDTAIKGSKTGGGTSRTFDWSIAEKVQAAGLPVIVAGGLTPGNIKEAVNTIRPYGVDVSSGVEASPGRKDHAKVRDFLSIARETALESNKGI